jgi:hypothetical protein
MQGKRKGVKGGNEGKFPKFGSRKVKEITFYFLDI